VVIALPHTNTFNRCMIMKATPERDTMRCSMEVTLLKTDIVNRYIIKKATLRYRDAFSYSMETTYRDTIY
jgi:hypothetical protein